MDVIDKNTVVVYTSLELKTCLEGNNQYNYIYFGGDITLSSGITISSTKTNVIIDGTYNGTKYTYTDMKSAGSGDTISARSSNIKSVVVKNINVIGNNYYGIIFVPEETSLQNVVVEYNNLNYVGPQITFHPTGLSRYIDCDIRITTSYSAANEVAECNRIEIGGKTTIVHETTSNSSFWFRGSNTPYFKILENANVSFQSINRELFYGTYNLEFVLQHNSNFLLTSAQGVGYGSYTTSSVLIDTNATLKIVQTKRNGSYPTWYISGKFIMNENSNLYMINNYDGITTSNYNIYFKTTSSSISLNNPNRVVLYNAKANVIYSEQNINFDFTYNRINLWDASASIDVAGSLSDLPTYSWYKSSELSNVTGILSRNSTTISSNNYTEEELTKLPDLSNFKLNSCKTLSIGSMPLSIDAVTDTSTVLSGHTTKLSQVKISYNDVSKVVEADDNGYFFLNLEELLPIGTSITYLSNVKNSFIYQEKTIQIIYAGELTLNSAPENIQFSLVPFSLNPVLCPPKENISIVVIDSRVNSSNWHLYAKINHDLETIDGNVLSNSIVFINEDNDVVPLTVDKILVYTGENNNGTKKITTITFEQDKGIALRILNEPLIINKEYSNVITWILEE